MAKLTKIKLTNFTAFKEIDIALGKGINVFIGSNGTGKTHLLKLLYAACDVTVAKKRFVDKVVGVFRPVNKDFLRLCHQNAAMPAGGVSIVRWEQTDRVQIQVLDWPLRSDGILPATVFPDPSWNSLRMDSVYIPVKDMLAHSKGFVSLSELYDLPFEDVYPDIIKRALLPELKELPNSALRDLQHRLEDIIGGKVQHENETFFLQNNHGSLDFSLVAEGLRKFALLLVLINNGMLKEGNFLFWDEPEANINPSLLGGVADILLTLEELGVQIFIATHNYVLLKELELRRQKKHNIVYHGLYREEESQEVMVQSVNKRLELQKDPILDAYASLYDREMENMYTRRER